MVRPLGQVVAPFLLALLGNVQPAAAQSGEGLGLAYIIFSAAAVHRLINFARPASVGSDIRGRVVAAGRQRNFRGRITSIERDTIVVADSTDTLRLARADLSRLESFRGYERKWAQGWAVGFVSLGVVGAVAGAASGGDTSCDDFCFTPSQSAVLLGVVGAVIGSSIGALVGLGVQGEHWSRVDRIAPDLKVTILPLRDRTIGFGASLRW